MVVFGLVSGDVNSAIILKCCHSDPAIWTWVQFNNRKDLSLRTDESEEATPRLVQWPGVQGITKTNKISTI